MSLTLEDVSKPTSENWLQEQLEYYTTKLGYEVPESRVKEILESLKNENFYVYIFPTVQDSQRIFLEDNIESPKEKQTLQERLGISKSSQHQSERPFCYEEQLSADAKAEDVMYQEQQITDE
jgi:selenophosphate synthetase-related protein